MNYDVCGGGSGRGRIKGTVPAFFIERPLNITETGDSLCRDRAEIETVDLQVLSITDCSDVRLGPRVIRTISFPIHHSSYAVWRPF
jgi:hypothetical protein